MEHRSHRRVSVHRNIDVEYPGGKTVAGNVRDISSGGIFIELCTTDLPPHALVQLSIAASGRAQEAFIRVPAAITRRTQQGLGLLFCGRYGHIRDHVRAWSERIEPQWSVTSISQKPVRTEPLPPGTAPLE